MGVLTWRESREVAKQTPKKNKEKKKQYAKRARDGKGLP